MSVERSTQDYDSEIRSRVAELGAANSPIGAYSDWPDALRNAVTLIAPAQAQIVMFWGPDYVALYNAAYAPTIGEKHPKAFGRPAAEGWAELWDDLEPLLRRVRETGETVFAKDRPFYLERHGGVGEQVFFDISYSPIAVDGTVAGVLCIVGETTDRVVLQRQAIAERNRLWTLSQDPFLITDADGVWLSASPAWTRVLGWSNEELIGRTSVWMQHPDDQARLRAELRKLEAGQNTSRFENRFRCRDGSYRWFSWTAVPEGRQIFCVARDITVEREAVETQRELEAQLRQSQKMEAVGQLTGGLAHDFNNLLTGISGSLELLRTRLDQGRLADADRYITAAQNAARRAAALTHRLLAFSRRQTLDPKSVDVNRLVADLEELVRRTVGPEVSVEAVAAGGLWRTLIDPNQLENAILNLCINARDAMPDGGRLTIETANRWLDERSSRERDLEPGQYISICVSDTGTGMSPDIVSQVFDPFFTTKPLGTGTGLGLSMVYGFVRQSGGQVRIYSELGQGSMVCLYLPRYVGPHEQASEIPALARAPRASAGETVLVVDDEATVRMLAVEVLEEKGYSTLEAPDGAAGLAILRSDARVDLVVTDVGLPGGMNGRQMIDAARLFRPGLRVLFITGYAENAVIGNGHLEAGMHVLTKPFGMEDLASKIKDLIGADTPA